jgi:hypothetical protein
MTLLKICILLIIIFNILFFSFLTLEGHLDLVLVEPILYQNYECRSMWSFDQAKIDFSSRMALQIWGHRLMQQKKLKKLVHQECCILNPLHQILPQKG